MTKCALLICGIWFQAVLTVAQPGELQHHASPPVPAYLWTLHSDTAQVYIMAVPDHFKAKHYPLNSVYLDYFDRADTLVVGIDASVLPESIVSRKMQRLGTYRAGDSLSEHLSASTWAAVQEFINSTGGSIALSQRLKPWLLSTSLTLVKTEQLGYLPEQAITPYFINLAKGQKKLLELESLDTQLAIMSYGDERYQEHRLATTIIYYQKIEQRLQQMLAAWFDGDDRALLAALNHDEMLRQHRQNLLQRRNFELLTKLQRYLNQPGSYFVIVDVAQVLGPVNIVQSLLAAGADISRIELR